MSHFRLKGTAGPLINQSFELGQRLVIGTGPDGELQVGKVEPHKQLAELLLSDDGRVELLSHTAGTELLVNGETVTRRELLPGDEVRCAQHAFLLQAPGMRPERVLQEEQPHGRRRLAPWLIATLAVAALATLAWQRGWLGI